MAWFRAETQATDALFEFAPRRLSLRGRVVTMNEAEEVIADGIVLIEGDRIAAVGPASDSSLVARAKPIETNGTIYPGLVEMHNHPAYNAIPLWIAPAAYDSRKEWRNDPRYFRAVTDPMTLLNRFAGPAMPKAIVRFVECRSLLGGVTTTQGLSISKKPGNEIDAYRGLVRNVELPDDPAWPAVQDIINDFGSFDEANKRLEAIAGDRKHPVAMHLSEGKDDFSRSVFDFLLRPDGSALIAGNFTAIHGTALDRPRLEQLKPAAGLVWSPLSNFMLYGETTKVVDLMDLDIPMALGSDWGPSGTKNLLGELKIARRVGDRLGLFSDLELVRMATINPARMIGWDSAIGSVEVGKRADLLIVDGAVKHPYTALIGARESDVVAVLIDGVPRVGRAAIIDPARPKAELIRIAGQDMVLDIDEDGHPLSGMTLASATANLSDALRHLPEIAERSRDHRTLLANVERYELRLDLNENPGDARIAWADKPIGRGDVDAMELDPITEVDDPSFRERLIGSSVIPEWLRASL